MVGRRTFAEVRLRLLAETPTRHAGALEQLAVLLLGHPLTPLLDDRTHAVAFRFIACDESRIDGTGRLARPIAETTSGGDAPPAASGQAAGGRSDQMAWTKESLR